MDDETDAGYYSPVEFELACTPKMLEALVNGPTPRLSKVDVVWATPETEDWLRDF